MEFAAAPRAPKHEPGITHHYNTMATHHFQFGMSGWLGQTENGHIIDDYIARARLKPAA
jgi:hypothetical protein